MTDAHWQATIQTFRDYLAAQIALSAANIEANRQEALRLAAEQAAYLKRRLIENPAMYSGNYCNMPLPLLSSGAIVERPRRLNIEVLEKETGVSKRKKQSVFSSGVTTAA